MTKQQRIFSWLNVFLFIINISAFITILLMNNRNVSSKNESSQYRSDDFLRKELKLSEEQFRTLSKLDGDVFRNYQLLLDKQCEFNFSMLEELSLDNPSKENLDSIANRIGTYQTLLKKQTARHFINVRSVCNDDQVILLENLLQSMMELGDQCATCNKRDCERRDRINK
jgi:hypothetical protein